MLLHYLVKCQCLRSKNWKQGINTF